MYEFHWPTKTIFGAGVIREINQYLQPAGSNGNLLLVAPQEPWAAPLLERIKASLIPSGWQRVDLFAEVEPNPSWRTVEKGTLAGKQLAAGAVLALGGGSTMDAGKVIAQRCGADVLCTIPTTAGTGGEISPWAVISNLETREKDSVVAKWPELSLLDPELTHSVPPVVTLFTGIDAFIHGLEAYLASAATAITDALALQGMKLVAANLETAINKGENTAARSGMLEGSLLTGAAMLHAGLGLMHAISNVTGGLYHDLPHGLILMRCLDPVLSFNQPAVGEKYLEIKELVREVQGVTQRQFEILTVPEVAVKKEDLDLLADRAVWNVNAKTNPRPADAADVKGLVRDSFTILEQ